MSKCVEDVSNSRLDHMTPQKRHRKWHVHYVTVCLYFFYTLKVLKRSELKISPTCRVPALWKPCKVGWVQAHNSLLKSLELQPIALVVWGFRDQSEESINEGCKFTWMWFECRWFAKLPRWFPSPKECKCWARLCYRRGDLPSLWIRVGRKHTTCRISCRQHSPYPSETKIYWCYLQLWHRLHTPSTSQTCIARVLGGLGIYYVKLLLIGLHIDRKQHFHEVWRGDIKRLVLLLGKWENKEISGGVCKDLWKISKTNYST